MLTVWYFELSVTVNVDRLMQITIGEDPHYITSLQHILIFLSISLGLLQYYWFFFAIPLRLL